LRKIIKRLSLAQAANASPTGLSSSGDAAPRNPALHMTAFFFVIQRNARAALALQGSTRAVITAITASPAAVEVST
jgi:hypothetical protein